MKECDILRGSKHTLTPPTYFQEVVTPNSLGSTPLSPVLNLRPRSLSVTPIQLYPDRFDELNYSYFQPPLVAGGIDGSYPDLLIFPLNSVDDG